MMLSLIIPWNEATHPLFRPMGGVCVRGPHDVMLNQQTQRMTQGKVERWNGGTVERWKSKKTFGVSNEGQATTSGSAASSYADISSLGRQGQSTSPS